MNLKLCYITGWSLLVATGLSAQNRGDLAVKVARDSGQVIELTLQEAVDMARTNSPSAVSARHTFRSAYWSYRSFRANYLPSLTFSSNPDLTRTISKVTLGDGSEKYVSQNMLTVDGELSISQNVSLTGGSFFVQSSLQRMKLFDSNSVSFRSSPIIIGYSQSLFGYNSLRWDRRIEPVRYREAKKAYVESLELVSAETVNKFFALAQAQSNYDMARFNYNNADTLYKFGKGRYEIGRITENELLQLEINRLNESTNVMDASIEMDNCRQALCVYLGLDKNVILKVRVNVEVPRVQVNPEQAYELFNRNSPDIDDLERQLLESKSGVAQARANAGLKADLYVQCGLSQTGTTFNQAYTNPNDQQQVRVGISLPILDWGRGRGRVKVAKSREELVKIQVEQQRNNLEMNVRKLVLQFNLQADRVQIAMKTDQTARRRHEVARKLYLLGKSTILDLNASVTEKDSASRNFLYALSNYWNLYYMLRSMTLYDFARHSEISVDYKKLEN